MAFEWKKALRLVRAASGLPPGNGREAALGAARLFLSSASDERLRALSRLLAPGAGDKALLCALVPLERNDARCRLTDADLGISTADRTADAPSRRDCFPVAVALDNLRSALNVGSILRTCDFFGVESAWLCGYTAGPENPQVGAAALGAESVVDVVRFGSVSEAVSAAKAEGRFVVALETRRGAPPPQSVELRFPALVLLGSERFGLDPDVVAASDAVSAIAPHGVKNSLNVAVAFAVAISSFRSRFDAQAASHSSTVST
jgi:tRNA(Leu) C34 or U34 (ribose-2'-O)-methylase TrmL